MTPDQVIAHFGGQDESILETARQLRCAPQTIYNWLSIGEVPWLRQLDIQDQTKGRLKAEPRPENED